VRDRAGVTVYRITPASSAHLDRSWGHAVEITANAALFRSTTTTLNAAGRWMPLVVRLLGPVILGLLLLAIAGRVTRSADG
jgi:hypothetical protein